MQTYIGIKTSFIQITNNIVTNVSKNDSRNVDFSGIEAVSRSWGENTNEDYTYNLIIFINE